MFHVRKVVVDGPLCVGTTSAVSPAQESSYEADWLHSIPAVTSVSAVTDGKLQLNFIICTFFALCAF